jgi:hypothetical protein
MSGETALLILICIWTFVTMCGVAYLCGVTKGWTNERKENENNEKPGFKF